MKSLSAINPEEIISILKEEIEKRLPKWEAQTGLKCDERISRDGGDTA